MDDTQTIIPVKNYLIKENSQNEYIFSLLKSLVFFALVDSSFLVFSLSDAQKAKTRHDRILDRKPSTYSFNAKSI